MLARAWIAVLVVTGSLAGAATAEANLQIEQAASTEVLAAGAVVEFVVTVRNSGEHTVSTGAVLVTLSPRLAVPAGTAAFFSQGTFDPVEGRWTLGDLRAAEHATLSFHAEVAPDPLPPCVFSRARLLRPADEPLQAGDSAFATLRRPGVTSCVDLVVEPPKPWPRICGEGVYFSFRIFNFGPDPAQSVRITVRQEPTVLPDLAFSEFTGPCMDQQECVLTQLLPYHFTGLSLRAHLRNAAPAQLRLEIKARSDGTELVPGNETAGEDLTISAFAECDFGVGPIEVPLAGGGGASCFIATAAYGSPLHPHVEALRRFRDRFLLSHAPGRVFVALYYRGSPPVAAYIATRPTARALARTLLAPLVLAVAYPGAVLGILTGVLLAWPWRRRIRGRIPLPRSFACSTTRMDDIPRSAP